MNARPAGESGEKMKGDGEGESGGTRKSNSGKLNNDIKMTRREFIKASAAFGAAAAGVPYNLTDITNLFLKEDGELVIYPVIPEYKFDLVRKLLFKRLICIEVWGCNWNCRWCCLKFSKDLLPITMPIDQIAELLLGLGNNKDTMLMIGGGEPLLQKNEVLKLIGSLKRETNYIVMLTTNGSLLDENFIDRANDLCLDGINIPFRHIDDSWHKKITRGYSNQSTIKALKLVTERFKGRAVVTLPLYSCNTEIFENTCKFLREINPDFVIKVVALFPDKYDENPEKYDEEKCEKIGYDFEEIALRYFNRMDRSGYFSKQIEYAEYQIKEEGIGKMGLTKRKDLKKRKVVETYG